MRYISLILLGIFSLSLQAQDIYRISFRDGDHIYYMEKATDPPIHYQLDVVDLSRVALIWRELTKYGKPECQVYFDPAVASKTIWTDSLGIDRVTAIFDPLNPRVIASNPDTATQPIYFNKEVRFCEGKYLVIPTPHLTRATSFKICTKNRVFVFVTNPTIEKIL